jgi:CMP-N-acetylneuraminic acid synthetase
MNIVLIMAKEGSIGLPGKNTWKIKDRSLLGWTIDEAKKSSKVDQVFVSTNGQEVAQEAEKYGATVVMRDAELAKNEKFLEAVDHAIQAIEKDYAKPEIIAIPQCVVSFRDPDIFDRCITQLEENPEYDSAVTVRQVGLIPEAIMKMKDGDISPYFEGTQEKVSPSRQDSAGFEIDHAVECFRYNSWKNRQDGMKPWNYLGQKIKGIEQSFHNPNCFVDVHTLDDVKWLEMIVNQYGFEGLKRGK